NQNRPNYRPLGEGGSALAKAAGLSGVPKSSRLRAARPISVAGTTARAARRPPRGRLVKAPGGDRARGTCLGEANMTRWWLSVALTAVCLGQAPALRAQYLPCPPAGGGSLPPEPAPFSLTEPATPGPLSPKVAPHVPLDCLGIPDNVPGAFGDC